MSGVNKVILIGRLGKDPEVKNLPSGNIVANFSMATSEKYKDKTTGEFKEVTEWHNIVIWGKLAEVAAKYLHKGDMVYVEGKIATRSWEKEGVKRYTTEIIVHTMTMLSSKKPAQESAAADSRGVYEQPATVSSGVPPTTTGTDATDDLPF